MNCEQLISFWSEIERTSSCIALSVTRRNFVSYLVGLLRIVFLLNFEFPYGLVE